MKLQRKMILTYLLCLFTVVIATTTAGNDSAHTRSCCNGARWVKLNRDLVCFGAAKNSFGSFRVNKDLLVHKLKFVYRSGRLTCADGSGHWGFFGCTYPSVVDYVATYLTDAANNIIVPAAPIYHRGGSTPGGWYRVNGFKNGATVVTLSTGSSSFEIKAGQALRVWYGEDLFNVSENNNGGRTCTDIYGLI